MAISGKVKFWAGMAVSLGLMVYLFSKIDFHRLWQVMRGVDPFWLALSTVLNIGFFVIRAARWRFFMEPVKRDVGMWPLFSATMIGFMANNILPARLGEFVRAYALGRREKVPASSVFATVVVERLFDGLSVVLLLIIVLANIPQTPAFAGMAGTLRVAGEVSLAAYLLIMLALFFFIYRPEALPKAAGWAAGLFSHKLADKASALAGKFITGLAVIRRPRLLAPIIIYSALHWGLLFVPILLLFKAFGLHYGVYEAIFFIVAMSFAVALPSTPGYVGTYHAGATAAMVLLGTDTETAFGIAILSHAINFVPVTAIGLICLYFENLSLGSIKKVEAAEET